MRMPADQGINDHCARGEAGVGLRRGHRLAARDRLWTEGRNALYRACLFSRRSRPR